jgi:hypothetical protein
MRVIQPMRKSTELPDLTKKQWEFLELYRRLELRLGHAPSLLELGEAHGGYAEGSERSGAQRMVGPLVELGLIEMPRMEPVGGGTTKLGLAVLKRSRGKAGE